ncbi:MAG: uridylate kinase [Synergistaceae bacterium]|nr:uridylate kinase [Synergistaceae bacterium]
MLGVVKIGGAVGNKLEPLMKELSERAANGERWILVHGASGVMDALCAERGVEIRMVTSPSGYRSRFVGEVERALFKEAAMSYGAQIKNTLDGFGAKSEQADPEILKHVFAKRKDVIREVVNGRTRILRGNYSGTVTKIDGSKVLEVLNNYVIPILPPLALDPECGLAINIDGDRLAAATGGEVKADVMVILSNVPGLMKNIEERDSLIKTGHLADWDILEHYAKGNMKRKLVACREGLEAGIPKVYLADGRADAPIAHALGGEATCLTR